MRAFSSYSCLTACDQFQSMMPALLGGKASYLLNYFRCYTFEGGNDDDVTNTGTIPNVVCKSTLLLSYPTFESRSLQ